MIKRLLLFVLAGFIALNFLAYHHARSFFVYSSGRDRTPSPENLSWPQKIHVLLTGIRVPKPKEHSSPADYGLPFEPIALPGRDGTALSAWRLPGLAQSPLIILFHGYNSEKSGLLPEAVRFYRLGLEVLMVDFGGHGHSPGNETTLGIREADDVKAVFTRARAENPDRKIFLYGHSMGGAAVLRAMALYGVTPDGALVESVFDNLLNAVRFRFALLNAPSFPAAEILLFWANQQLGVDGFTHDLVAYARGIEVPVLVSHGTRDNRASVEGAQRVHGALPGEKSFLLIEGAGHVNPCLADEAAWMAAVSNFISPR